MIAGSPRNLDGLRPGRLGTVALVVAALAMGGCRSGAAATASPQPGEAAGTPLSGPAALPPEAAYAATAAATDCIAAQVDELEVKDIGDGRFMALIRGSYTSPCDQPGPAGQTRNGDEIRLDVCSVRVPGTACPDERLAFSSSMTLNTDGLAAGTYTVIAGERKATFEVLGGQE